MTRLSKLLLVATVSVFPLGMLPACTEVYHDKEVHRNIDGSRTRTETTVRENPDGTTTVEKDTIRK